MMFKAKTNAKIKKPMGKGKMIGLSLAALALGGLAIRHHKNKKMY